MGRIILLLLTFACFFSDPAVAAANGKRVALIVTNANYANGIEKLDSPHRDGDSLTAALDAIGFEVRHVRDTTRDTFTAEILSFVKRVEAAGEDAIAFFYYSGHGAADREFVGQNFMIPIGSGFAGVADLEKNAVSLENVINPLKANQSRSAKSFIVLDACRNVPFASTGPNVTNGFIRRDRVTSMLISYATDEGQVSLDENFFSSSLSAMLPDPELEAARVFKKVKERVFQLSGEKQTPWYEDGIIGDFYFARGAKRVSELDTGPKAPEPKPPSAAPPPPVDRIEPPPSLPAPAAVPAGAVLRPGQAIVTRFSGTKSLGTKSLGREIDPQGPVIAVADTARTPAAGPRMPAVTAADIGQVYGAAVDPGSELATATPRAPDLYLAATSAYGLSISTKEPGSEPAAPLERGGRGATWADGQFGAAKGGGPGAIWKVDGATGAVSLFTEIALDGVKNSGPGLGQLAYDPRTRQLFVSDLDTGMIHRVSMKGAELGFYDHGVEGRPRERLEPVSEDPKERAVPTSPKFRPSDPTTWGFPAEGRRVWGLAVRGDRLYYGVAEGPQVWSVGIAIDGTFGRDGRREIEIPGAPNGSQIPSIGFDAEGNMYLAVLAGMTVLDVSTGGEGAPRPTQAAIVRFKPRAPSGDGGGPRWQDDPDDLTEGASSLDRQPGGALALGPGLGANGELDLASCGSSLWIPAVTTGDGGAAGKPVLLGWTGQAKARGGEPAHLVNLDSAGAAPSVPPGSITMVAPCVAPQQIGGLMTVPGTPPAILPPARATPPAAVIEQTAIAPQQAPDGPGPRTAGSTPTGRPDRQETGNGGNRTDTGQDAASPFTQPPPCMSLEGARFQCVGQAWELDVNLGDKAHKGLDALKVSSLTPNSTVEPGLQTRTRPTDPFRVRFDQTASGAQVPIDVCLFDLAASLGGKRYRCCRAQLQVTLPSAPCGEPTAAPAAVAPAVTTAPTKP